MGQEARSAARRYGRERFEATHDPQDFLRWLNAYVNETGREDHELHALCSHAHSVIAALQNEIAALLPHAQGAAMPGSEHPAATTESRPEILDACCGGRMWWWDKEHPLAVYMDVREAPRGSVGELTGRPEWNPNWSCEPTCEGDFRNMPFEDESFQLVVFDPPHYKGNPGGINGLKYGSLHWDTEQEDLRLGFAECWRVLRPGGTLVFKWGASSTKRVEPHFPAVPIVGTRSPRGGQTRWFIFYKPLDAAALEAVA